MKLRNKSPRGDLTIPGVGNVAAGEIFEAPDELGSSLAEQAEVFEVIGHVIKCPDCAAELAAEPGARIEHNEDGSHVFTPAAPPSGYETPDAPAAKRRPAMRKSADGKADD